MTQLIPLASRWIVGNCSIVSWNRRCCVRAHWQKDPLSTCWCSYCDVFHCFAVFTNSWGAILEIFRTFVYFARCKKRMLTKGHFSERCCEFLLKIWYYYYSLVPVTYAEQNCIRCIKRERYRVFLICCRASKTMWHAFLYRCPFLCLMGATSFQCFP